MTCSREWQAQAIDDARLGEADITAFERHVASCVTCRAAQARLAELRVLGQELPVPAPSELEMRRLRARVLHDAMPQPVTAPRRTALVVALAVAGLALVGVGALRPPSIAPFVASVRAEPGAAWTQERHGRIERVVLSDGAIALRVRKQEEDERFLVIVPDGEVEVRGTTFEVAVHERHTTRVHVDEGVVIVRVHGSSTLVAGDSWPSVEARADALDAKALEESPPPEAARGPVATARAATAEDLAPPSVSLARAPILSKATAPSAAPSVAASATSRAADAEGLGDYEHAVDVYRGGHFEEAGELFHAFTVAHASSSLLDDASFLEASSLSNAGRNDAAALLAERHLARFPSSFHRKEAAILVARLRRDRGDCDGARKIASAWLAESLQDPRVRAALGGCAGE